MKLRVVATVDSTNGITRKGKRPWYLPSNELRFAALVLKNTVVADAPIGSLINDLEIVHCRTLVIGSEIPGAEAGKSFFPDLEKALAYAAENPKGDIWVAGGQELLQKALPLASELVLTHVERDFSCDEFFPEFDALKYEQSILGSDWDDNYQCYVITKSYQLICSEKENVPAQ